MSSTDFSRAQHYMRSVPERTLPSWSDGNRVKSQHTEFNRKLDHKKKNGFTVHLSTCGSNLLTGKTCPHFQAAANVDKVQRMRENRYLVGIRTYMNGSFSCIYIDVNYLVMFRVEFSQVINRTKPKEHARRANDPPVSID